MEALIMHICESNCALRYILHTHSLLYLALIYSTSQQFLAHLDILVVPFDDNVFPKAILLHSEWVFQW
jgi:hypothetical protein